MRRQLCAPTAILSDPGATVRGVDETYRALVLPPPPAASSEGARRVLSRTGRRDTAPELALRRELHRLGMRFLVDVTAPGTSRRRRVDVLLRGARVAVLVHGCFWHGCPEHFHAPKANAQWWRLKHESVRRRDADSVRQLEGAGWLPVVVWEHEDMAVAALRLVRLHEQRRPGLHPRGNRPLPVARDGRSANEVERHACKACRTWARAGP